MCDGIWNGGKCGYEEEIKINWINKVRNEDRVIKMKERTMRKRKRDMFRERA